jgi:hypothetical protein
MPCVLVFREIATGVTLIDSKWLAADSSRHRLPEVSLDPDESPQRVAVGIRTNTPDPDCVSNQPRKNIDGARSTDSNRIISHPNRRCRLVAQRALSRLERCRMIQSHDVCPFKIPRTPARRSETGGGEMVPHVNQS